MEETTVKQTLVRPDDLTEQKAIKWACGAIHHVEDGDTVLILYGEAC